MTESPVFIGNFEAIAPDDPIWAARGKAIQAYALLEQSLMRAFVALTGMEPYVAGVVFFKNTSSQARTAIFEKLIRHRYGAKYNLFWNSLIKHLGQIDKKRNAIVHWNAVTRIRFLTGEYDIRLVPPNFWAVTEDVEFIDCAGLNEFSTKCAVFANICNHFFLNDAGYATVEPNPWPDIFRSPIVYPLPEDHPSHPSNLALDDPPPPSPG